MTPADLAALERLLAEATPGRWSHRSKLEDGTPCCDVIGDSDDDWSIVATGNPDLFDMRDADARLIAAAVNALPALIAAARERDGLRAHYDAAGPEHNLPALLDLYEERRASATAERDALRAEVERMRAVVEAARLYVTDEPSAGRFDRIVDALDALAGPLAALDAAKEGE